MWVDADTKSEQVWCVVRTVGSSSGFPVLDTHSLWTNFPAAQEAARRLNEQFKPERYEEWHALDRVLWTTLPAATKA